MLLKLYVCMHACVCVCMCVSQKLTSDVPLYDFYTLFYLYISQTGSLTEP